MRITLEVGPKDKPRHRLAIESNLSASDLAAAYALGAEKLGLVGLGEWKGFFESALLSPAQLQTLQESGYPTTSRNLNTANFPLIWLHIASVGDPSLVWSFDTDVSRTLDIGGEGVRAD